MRVLLQTSFVFILIALGEGRVRTSVRGHGSVAEEIVMSIRYSWPQEPGGYDRTAKVYIPHSQPGEKVPVVFTLHGAGGQGNTHGFSHFLPECIIVAPDGYEHTWNVYFETSKADDVQFMLDLIAKIEEEIPSADMSNVNIAGTSNGAAMVYQLLIATEADRPFQRVFPMVSSLIAPQFHQNQFWMFSQAADQGDPNNFDTPRVPEFTPTFEYAHFHGTEDGTIPYEGQNPGPPFLNNVEIYPAQWTDYTWAWAMGYDGLQYDDSDGLSVGTADKPAFEYKYLEGRCRHYKLVGENHGTAGPGHPVTQQIIREMVLGPGA